MSDVSVYRSSFLHFLRMPESIHDTGAYEYIEDGLMLVENGKIKQLGEYDKLKPLTNGTATVKDYTAYLIMPGFIDTHTHYPQLDIIASYGTELLDWLDRYVFPAEKKYKDIEYAKKRADFYLSELLRNGTTTALVFPAVFKESSEAFFECANRLNMCMINGKVLMDRNAPTYLRDTPETAYKDSKDLIQKWHKKNRQLYAVTPRFAPTSTEAQLEVTSQLLQEFPDVYFQTHLSENKNEVEFVKQLYPWSKDYLNVYEKNKLLGPKSIFAHCIYLTERELAAIKDTKSIISWCPTSNLFIGSGLFRLSEARKHNIRLSLATDSGGGTSLSMLQTLSEAYKVAALQGEKLSPLESFYYITLGNAKALSLDSKLGNFKEGKDADFVVLDWNSTAYITHRMKIANSLFEKLFILSILGDDRAIKATYVYDKLRYDKEEVKQ